MRMDVFEMRILYEDLFHDILFYFLFFIPFFISSPSLLLSARRCGVSAQWDHPSIKSAWAACGGFFLLIFCRWGFFLQVALFSSSVQASVASHEHTVPPVIPNNNNTKRPKRLVLIYFPNWKNKFKCMQNSISNKNAGNEFIMQTFNKP